MTKSIFDDKLIAVILEYNRAKQHLEDVTTGTIYINPRFHTCQCGRVAHDQDAIYCVECGSALNANRHR